MSSKQAVVECVDKSWDDTIEKPSLEAELGSLKRQFLPTGSVIGAMSPLAVTDEPKTEHLPNAITSWRLLKKRQRWYRSLDAGYLSLKVFLLERFLHDILFESTNPNLLRDFVGADTTLSN